MPYWDSKRKKFVVRPARFVRDGWWIVDCSGAETDSLAGRVRSFFQIKDTKKR